MRIVRHSFVPERLRGATIVKLPNLRRSDIYVTNTLVEREAQIGLLGFHFRLVWSDRVPAA